MFLTKALGTYFSKNENDLTGINETVFFGDEQTIIVIKETTSTMYQLSIESASGQIVRGMIGYLEEVIDENSLPYQMQIYS